jgi:hypothetical protein
MADERVDAPNGDKIIWITYTSGKGNKYEIVYTENADRPDPIAQ